MAGNSVTLTCPCGAQFEASLRGGRGAIRRYCDECRETLRTESRQRYKARLRAAGVRPGLWQQHRMSPEEYAEMVHAQKGKCAGCHRIPQVGRTELFIDHDHSCCPGKRSCAKCRRGLLCVTCNMALGLVHEDPVLLRNLAEYIERLR